jgi:uncharacterized membrane protein
VSATRIGMIVGAVLALTLVIWGFWAFLLVALGIAVGALSGRIAEGKIDVRALLGALSGRRSSS